MNAIAEICRQAGLTTPSAVARLLGGGIDHNDAVDLLSPQPPRHVQSAMRLLSECGATLRLPLKPLSFWLDRPHLDQLYCNNACRTDMGLTRCPKTRGEFAELVRDMRQTLGYDEIADRLNRDMIPQLKASEKNEQWTGKSVDRCALVGPKTRAIVPTDADLSRWHDEVVDMVLSRCCQPDPTASIRWGFEWTEADGRIAVTTQPMPAGPRRWIVTWLSDRVWLAGRWGIPDPARSA